ncbi:hypothetical protein ACP70R_011659 [Stipagrostis hirtigluma subsp. patula]
MRIRIAGRKSSSDSKAGADGGLAAPPAAAAADAKNAAGGAALAATVAGADRDGTDVNGSKDDSFFEARPWLDSDSEDDFYSVRGDFTPSRGSTPDHQRQTSFTGRISVDRLKPSITEKKQKLLDLLQEKQQYDDELDRVTDVGSDMENSSVHAEEHLKPSQKVKKVKKSSNSGCFPSLTWKHKFRMCRK